MSAAPSWLSDPYACPRGTEVIDTFLGITATVLSTMHRDDVPTWELQYERPSRHGLLDSERYGVLPLTARVLRVLSNTTVFVPVDDVTLRRFEVIQRRAAVNHDVLIGASSSSSSKDVSVEGAATSAARAAVERCGLASRMVAPWTVDVGRLVARYGLLPGMAVDVAQTTTTESAGDATTAAIVLGVDPSDGISVIVMIANTGEAHSLGPGCRVTVRARFPHRELDAKYWPRLPAIAAINLDDPLPVDSALVPFANDISTDPSVFFDLPANLNGLRDPVNRVGVSNGILDTRSHQHVDRASAQPFSYRPRPLPPDVTLQCQSAFVADVLEYAVASAVTGESENAASAAAANNSTGGVASSTRAEVKILVDTDPLKCRALFGSTVHPGAMLLMPERGLLLTVVGVAHGHRSRGTAGLVELVVLPSGASAVQFALPDVTIHVRSAQRSTGGSSDTATAAIPLYEIVPGDDWHTVEALAQAATTTTAEESTMSGQRQATVMPEEEREHTVMYYQPSMDGGGAAQAASLSRLAASHLAAHEELEAFEASFETPADISHPSQLEALAVVRSRQADMKRELLVKRMVTLRRACASALCHLKSARGESIDDEQLYQQELHRVVATVLQFVRRECPLMTWFHAFKVVGEDQNEAFDSRTIPEHQKRLLMSPALDPWTKSLTTILMRDTHFRNLFEVLHGSGCECTTERGSWEESWFDRKYADDTAPFHRPKYGVLNLFNDPEGQNAWNGHYGECYLVFRSSTEFRRRTTLTSADSGEMNQSLCDFSFGVPIALAESHPANVAAMAVQALGGQSTASSQATEYREVQVHGRVCLHRHVTMLVVPDVYWTSSHGGGGGGESVNKLQWGMLTALAAKHGWWIVPRKAMRLMAAERLSSRERLKALIRLFATPVTRIQGSSAGGGSTTATAAAVTTAATPSRIIHPSGPLYHLAGPQGQSRRDLYDEFCHRLCRYVWSMPLRVDAEPAGGEGE